MRDRGSFSAMLFTPSTLFLGCDGWQKPIGIAKGEH